MYNFKTVSPVILVLGLGLLASGCAAQKSLPVVVRETQATAQTAQQNASAALAASQKAESTADSAAQAAQEAMATAMAAQAKVDALVAPQQKAIHHRHHRHHKAKHNA